MISQAKTLRYVVAIFFLSGICLSTTSGKTQSEASQPTSSSKDGEKNGASIYTVSKYDAERKAAQDLAATVKRAKPGGKRIILEIGGDW